MTIPDGSRRPDRWAAFRFSIVGSLLATPRAKGELKVELLRLSEKLWLHPVTGEPVRFSVTTIERWYYQARARRDDPIGALDRRVRSDAGSHRKLSPTLRALIRKQHRDHKSWSYQLHFDNLEVVVAKDRKLGPMPSYSTVRRYMKRQGLHRQRLARAPRDTDGARRAVERLETLEVRSYEAEYVSALWHLDFHQGSRPVLMGDGSWVYPQLLGVLDDHSRLACHLQWYTEETAEALVHGLSQAFQKRGLPAALMTDNGSAMKAAETRAGLLSLSVSHAYTLDYSPYQNAKQESFWGQIEGRLLPMLEGEAELTLELLNAATQAWVELEYNRELHSEIGIAPLRRFLDNKSVARECPDSGALRRVFRDEAVRKQRRSDGTVSLFGRRYEIPSRYRHFERVHLAYARWDRATVEMFDPKSRTMLCRVYPLDKTKNASGERRRLEPVGDDASAPLEPAGRASGIAPLLSELMTRYAESGLPPAYLPKTPRRSSGSSESETAPNSELTPVGYELQGDDPS